MQEVDYTFFVYVLQNNVKHNVGIKYICKTNIAYNVNYTASFAVSYCVICEK